MRRTPTPQAIGARRLLRSKVIWPTSTNKSLRGFLSSVDAWSNGGEKFETACCPGGALRRFFSQGNKTLQLLIRSLDHPNFSKIICASKFLSFAEKVSFSSQIQLFVLVQNLDCVVLG